MHVVGASLMEKTVLFGPSVIIFGVGKTSVTGVAAFFYVRCWQLGYVQFVCFSVHSFLAFHLVA